MCRARKAAAEQQKQQSHRKQRARLTLVHETYSASLSLMHATDLSALSLVPSGHCFAAYAQFARQAEAVRKVRTPLSNEELPWQELAVRSYFVVVSTQLYV